MARGRGQGRGRGGRGRGGGGRGGFGRGQKRKSTTEAIGLLSKKEKTHFAEFGAAHPLEERNESSTRYRKVRDDADQQKIKQVVEQVSSSSEDEEPGAYSELLSTLKTTAKSDAESSDQETSSNSDLEAADDMEEDTEELQDLNIDKQEHLDANMSDESEQSEQQEQSDTHSDHDDEDNEIEKNEQGVFLPETDPFRQHFGVDIEDNFVDRIEDRGGWKQEEQKHTLLGRCIVKSPKESSHLSPDFLASSKVLSQLHINECLLKNIARVNQTLIKEDSATEDGLTPLQHCMFGLLNNYQDVFYPELNLDNAEELRLVYCIHAANHVLKTRGQVIANNNDLQMKKGETTDSHRDQGLTRPKVLMVVPFRDSALRIVQLLWKLMLPRDQCFITNKKKFIREFTAQVDTSKGHKPEDFEETFKGNIDDHFRIGIGLAKKSLKLYTDFYSADIIIASPLGLRTLTGAEGENERDFDMLSSIEMLIIDQVDTLLMQNWDHLLHLMAHLHLQPQASHDVDFSRVRMWTLNGWSKYYRQTLMFGSLVTPEFNSLFNRYCHNYAGRIQALKHTESGSICQIVTPLPQAYQRLEAVTFCQLADARFEYFKTKVLPQFKDVMMKQTLIYVPSYFDYVRLRNFFKKEAISFVNICEYTEDKKVSRFRSNFYHGRTQFMLYTERFNFYKRYKLRGLRHIIFYQLPTFPIFYSELCNMLHDPRRRRADTQAHTCTVIYSKHDVHRLSAVLGSQRATNMVNGDSSSHMFVTGEA